MSNPARQQLSLRCEDNRVTKWDLVTSSSSLLPDRSCHLPAWIIFSIQVPQHWTFSVSIEVPGCQRLLMSRPLPQSAPSTKNSRVFDSNSDRLVALTEGLCQARLSSEKAQTNHFDGLTVVFLPFAFSRPNKVTELARCLFAFVWTLVVFFSRSRKVLSPRTSRPKFRPSSFTCAKQTPLYRVASGTCHPTQPITTPD
jgi:hypothetical protein